MDYYDLIEEYLKNNLSESDKVAFEQEMAADDQLRLAVENHDVAMEVVGSIFEGEIREVINNEQQAINNEQLIINNESEGTQIESGKLKI